VNPVSFIAEKRAGKEHSAEALEAFFAAYLAGQVADYQVAAWLMAVCFQGLSPQETQKLTEVMASSGKMLDLSAFPHPVDKHSSGGVGDKTSLVLAPLLAAAGCTVAKMSGRGLGHTGGTIDKLESLPGWRGELSEQEFLAQASQVGFVLAAQSAELAPLDGRLYALRDVTATVDSLPLIASSIMSKKLAAGARSIILDVKVGSGAFMRTQEEARQLAMTMVALGQAARRQVRAVLSSMEEPLGRAVGNALEVVEAARTLQGEGPRDLEELVLALAREVLEMEGLEPERAKEALRSGAGLAKLMAMVEAQGGDPALIEHPERIELAPHRLAFSATQAGVLARVDAREVAQAVLALGGGRRIKGEAIDHGVGVELIHKVGDSVKVGEPLAWIYHRGRGVEEAEQALARAFLVAPEAKPAPLILEVIR